MTVYGEKKIPPENSLFKRMGQVNVIANHKIMWRSLNFTMNMNYWKMKKTVLEKSEFRSRGLQVGSEKPILCSKLLNQNQVKTHFGNITFNILIKWHI